MKRRSKRRRISRRRKVYSTKRKTRRIGGYSTYRGGIRL